MNKVIFTLVGLSLAPIIGWSQEALLHAGPMVGYSEMQEAMIWVQTSEPADVSLVYWEKGHDDQTFITPVVQTSFESAFTAKIIVSPLIPGTHYEYQLYINDEPVDLEYPTEFQSMPIWKWREDPPDFRFVTGSCAYINEERFDRPGEPYGGEYRIFNSIVEHHPDFMVWLGDNVYYREPDWNSWTGIINRYTHDRATPELQPLLGSVHHYAIWDDHDYGPDNSDRGYWFKEKSLQAFRLFWANPSFGVGNIEGAITFFQWNDVDFILLDNRTYRAPDNLLAENKTMLGEKQKQWLKDVLVKSDATFKVIALGGQFLNPDKKDETYANFGFGRERQEIIDYIYEQNIGGVIFLTGDRHYTELSKLEEEKHPVIYDLTVSPFTSGVNINGFDVINPLRVEGTVVVKRNYAVIDVMGPMNGRVFRISVFDADGNMQWSKNINRPLPK